MSFWLQISICLVAYSDSQKHESSCLLSDCFSCISPEPLELQKSFLRLFASLSEELSDEKIIFQTRSQNQLIFAKTLFFQKKVSYWKKSAILKNSKTFFHGSKVQELNLHTNHFLAQKSSRNLFKSSQMCLPYFCESDFYQLS